MTPRFTIKLIDGKITLVPDLTHPVPKPDANQKHPRRFYVYAHCDAQGKVLYVREGTGRRAWDKNRHPLWARYVEKYLGGIYSIRILADNLSEDEACGLEAEFMAAYPDLVNWGNQQRLDNFNYEKSQQRWDRQKANKLALQQAKGMEKDNPEMAVELYLKAIENVKGYDDQLSEDAGTLLGQLICAR